MVVSAEISMPRALVQCRRGVAAVEFAIILPLLLALTLGTIEFGLLFFTYNSMQSAARDVARQIALNIIDPDDAEPMVADQIPTWSRDGLSVEVTQSDPGDPASNVIGVRLTLLASQATPLRFVVNSTGDWTLVTAVHMMQEMPFAELPN